MSLTSQRMRPSRFVLLADAIALAGVQETHFRAAAAQGEAPALVCVGGVEYLLADDLADWLNRLEAEARIARVR